MLSSRARRSSLRATFSNSWLYMLAVTAGSRRPRCDDSSTRSPPAAIHAEAKPVSEAVERRIVLRRLVRCRRAHRAPNRGSPEQSAHLLRSTLPYVKDVFACRERYKQPRGPDPVALDTR
jgi:hypothetical protein